MRGPRPFRIFLMGILALTALAQLFWVGRAWQVIDAMVWPGPRYLLKSLQMAALLAVVATALDLLVGPVIPRRGLGPWGRAVPRLCLIASCIGYLEVAAISGVE